LGAIACKVCCNHQQVQQQAGIASIVFLFPCLGRTDLGWMTHPTLDP
jgi:hypothetical protein